MADPSPSLDELTTPISRADLETSHYRVLGAVGVRTSNWKPGAVVRAIITAVCVVLHPFSVLSSKIARSGFLDLSSGVWLRICAYFGFNTPAKAATFATGRLRIDNTGALVFNEPAGDMVAVGANGQEYVILDAVSIGAYQTGVYVTARCSVVGSIGTAPAGTITRFGATYVGLTVTNPAELVGSDEETDAELVYRARLGTAAVSPNGPTDVYERVALDATREDGTLLGINRVRVASGPGDGSCTVYAATASGAVPGAANDLATDLGRLQYLLRTKACPPGFTANAATGVGLTINIVYQVWVYTTSGLSETQIRTRISDAVGAYIRAMRIGGDRPDEATGFVYLENLRAVIRGAIPEGALFHCVLTTPSADVACQRFSVPQVGTIAGTVTLVQA